MRRAADYCTGLRVLLAPVLAWLLTLPRDEARWAPFAVFLVAALTDYADGALARAFGTASRRGRVFDHGADAFLLFPSFLVLASAGHLPAVLPAAAMTSFALYVADGWRRGGSFGALELAGSRSGAIGGVLNYVVVGAAAAAYGLDAAGLDQAICAAAFAVAVVNVTAACERVAGFVMPARASLAAETEPRASRSSP